MNSSIHDDLVYFLKQCADVILARSKDELIKQGATQFKSRLEDITHKDFSLSNLPVLTSLIDIPESNYLFNFHQIANNLKWRPSPRADFEAQFMALSSLNEMLKLGNIVAGLMFMTPNQTYPEHKHAPQEVYFVLSGIASWLYGGNDEYQQQQPGDLIYNHPYDLHGMKTEDDPLLALYFLWGNKTEGYSY